MISITVNRKRREHAEKCPTLAQVNTMLFGNSSISVESLAAELQQRIPQIAAQQRNSDGNKAYTTAVKQALREIGNAAKLVTFYTGAEPHMKEFMLDVVLWNMTPGAQGAVIGAESEWGNPRSNDIEFRSNQVLEDFEKLRSFKAPLKILFFSSENESMRRRMHEKITTSLCEFAQHVNGEQYLFMEFSQGECYSYVWTAANDGPCPTAALVALNERSAQVQQRGIAAGA